MEIKVIKDVAVDIEKLSAEDREALFNRIRELNPQISISTLKSFSNMVSDRISDEVKYSKPQIMELLLRKVIQLGICNDVINMLVVPIIAFKQPVKKGGAKPFMRRYAEKLEDVPGAVKIRFDSRVLCSTSNYDYIASTNEEINVLGLTVNENCNEPLISIGELVPLRAFVVPPSDSEKRIKLGNFTPTADVFKFPQPKLEIGGMHKTAFVINTDDKFSAALDDIYNFLMKQHFYRQISEPWAISQYALALANQGASSDYYKDSLGAAVRWIFSPRNVDKGIPDKPLTNVEKLIEDVSETKINTEYSTNILNDLYVMDLAGAYYRAQILGEKDPSVEQILFVYKNRILREQSWRNLERDISDKRNRENMYRKIAERKFPSTYKKISIVLQQHVSILDLLSTSEKKQVVEEYIRREKYFDAIANNKCAHVRLYRTFREEPRIDKQKQYFDKLKGFFNKSTNGMINCKVCKFDIMCEHVKVQAEMEFANKRLSDISAVLTKFVTGAPGEPYFCKICGEIFSTGLFEVTPQNVYENTIPEDLRNLMYSEIITDLRYVKFSDIVNVQALVNTIRSAIYPFIYDIEKQILKSRTISAEEIKAKKKLFVSIYTFAYLIHLVVSNKANNISFKNVKSSSGLADIIKHVIGVLINSKNILIRAVPGVTNDIIKNKLIEAYKAVSMKGPMTVMYASDTENIIITTMLDPIYSYLFNTNQIAAIVSGSRAKIGIDPASQMERLLGGSVKQLEASDDIFGKAVLPKFKSEVGTRFDKLNFKKLYDELGTEIADVYSGYITRSFDLWYNMNKHRYYLEPYYIADTVSKYVSEQNSEWEKFSNSEQVLVRLFILASLKNVHSISATHTRLFVYEEVALGRQFDENGKKHKWKNFVLEDGTVTNVAGLEKILKSSAPEYKIVDLECKRCKIKRSEVGSLSDEKIRESLLAKSSIENFFRFYENRCPKEGLHEFDADGKCAKCSLTTKMQMYIQSKESLNYYRIHKVTYQKDREMLSGRSALEFPPSVDLDIGADKYADMFANWAFNFDIVLELADKIKVNHRAIICLGSIEKINYDDVLNGEYNPPESTSRYDTRIYILESLIRDFLQEYNQLRYFSRIAKPNPDISALVDNSGYNKHKAADLITSLIDVYDDHNEKFLYFKSVKKPREIVSYCIQKLCEMALRVYNDANAPTDKLRKMFVKYIIDKFLRQDMLTTKHGHFNWGLLYPDQNKIETDATDTNFEQDAGEEVAADDLDEDAEFGATNDAFKHIEDLDVDDVDNNDEDPANQVRVEGYSLD